MDHNEIMDDITPYENLARSVVAFAATDLIAVRHPKLMRQYIDTWLRRQSGNYIPAKLDVEAWALKQRKQLLEFFDNGGGELARAVNVEHYIYYATRRRISRKAAANIAKKDSFNRGR